jgi:hypothetical protein
MHRPETRLWPQAVGKTFADAAAQRIDQVFFGTIWSCKGISSSDMEHLGEL